MRFTDYFVRQSVRLSERTSVRPAVRELADCLTLLGECIAIKYVRGSLRVGANPVKHEVT